jgi:hypothetical protein
MSFNAEKQDIIRSLVKKGAIYSEEADEVMAIIEGEDF